MHAKLLSHLPHRSTSENGQAKLRHRGWRKDSKPTAPVESPPCLLFRVWLRWSIYCACWGGNVGAGEDRYTRHCGLRTTNSIPKIFLLFLLSSVSYTGNSYEVLYKMHTKIKLRHTCILISNTTSKTAPSGFSINWTLPGSSFSRACLWPPTIPLECL